MKNSLIFDQDSQRIIEQKAAFILDDLDRIQTLLKKFSYEQLATDELSCSAAERWLERTINRVIDINLHLIRKHGAKTPSTYGESFTQLAQLGIIDASFAEQLKPCIGTRNILVHEYDDLNMIQFYRSLEYAVALFPRFITLVRLYMTQHSQSR